MNAAATVQTGDTWYAWLDTVVSHEQSRRRPVLIESTSLLPEFSGDLVFAIPLTWGDQGVRTHILIGSISGSVAKPSLAMAEQLRSISSDRLVKRIAVADKDTIMAVREVIRLFLDLP